MSGQATPFSLMFGTPLRVHSLLPADLLQRQIGTFVLEFFDAIEDVAAVAQCLGSSKPSLSERRAVIVSVRIALAPSRPQSSTAI